LNLQSEAQRRSIEAAKTSAAIAAGETPKKKSAKERTVPMITDELVDGLNATLNAAKKKGSSDELTEQLTDSLRVTKLRESGELPIFDSSNHQTTEEDTQMAAKKKTAKKTAAKKPAKQTVNAANGSNKVKTAAPIGRERKLLLRLSVEEYEALQEKAAEKETSMANLLRTSALGKAFGKVASDE
jgi:hypothetical protein